MGGGGLSISKLMFFWGSIFNQTAFNGPLISSILCMKSFGIKNAPLKMGSDSIVVILDNVPCTYYIHS